MTQVIKSVEMAVSELNKYSFQYNPDRLHYLMEVHDVNTWNFNCWGTIAFMLGWVDCIDWLSCEHMTELLEDNSYPILTSEVQPGDIYVQHDYDGLAHTCLAVQSVNEVESIHDLMLFQKNGWTPIAMVTVDYIDTVYPSGEFFRPYPESIRR